MFVEQSAVIYVFQELSNPNDFQISLGTFSSQSLAHPDVDINRTYALSREFKEIGKL